MCLVDTFSITTEHDSNESTFHHYQDYYRGNVRGKNSSKCDSLKKSKNVLQMQ